MIVIGGLVLGAFIGVLTARKYGGSRLDMAQYGAGFGIVFGVIGLILTLILFRAGV